MLKLKRKQRLSNKHGGVWDMSKPYIIDPGSEKLALVSEYLGKGAGNGVLND